MEARQKLLITLFFLGFAGLATYINEGASNKFAFILLIVIITIPLVHNSIIMENKKEYIIIILFTGIIFQSLWLIGNGYVQGTDGAIHLFRSRRYIDSGRIFIYDTQGSLSSQFPNMYVLSNITTYVSGIDYNCALLLINPIFGIVSITMIYALLRRLLGEISARLSTVLFFGALTFVAAGTQVRTESMGIAIATTIFFSYLLLNRGENRKQEWRVLCLISSGSLVLTHIVASVHALALGGLAIGIVLLVDFIDNVKINHSTPYLLPLFLVLLISVMVFLNGTIILLLRTVLYALIDIMNVVTALPSSLTSSGSSAASGSGAGFVVFSVVWLRRILFLLCVIVILKNLIEDILHRNKINRIYTFLLFASGAYLSVILAITFAGDSVPLNPGRIYRIFEYFSSIIIAYGLIQILSLRETSSIPKQAFITILICILVVGSLTTLPVWTIDTDLRKGGEKPYLDYRTQDVEVASFADTYVSSESTFYGGRRTYRLFGSFGSHEPLRITYVSPASEKLTSKQLVYYDTRHNGNKYLEYDDSFVESSDKIYDNSYLALHITSGDQFKSNTTTIK